MHTWYSAVPAAPLPQKLYKKDGWLWVVYCPFCFCFSIYCNFFLGVALFFFQILSEEIRRGVFKLFLACSFWWFYLICLLSWAFRVLALIWLARMPWVETPKRSWCGHPKSAEFDGCKLIQIQKHYGNWSMQVLHNHVRALGGTPKQDSRETGCFFQKILHFLGRWSVARKLTSVVVSRK